MKKIILAVILVAAVGGAAYYLLQKKTQSVANSFQKDQLIGQWKLVQWTPPGESLISEKDTAGFFRTGTDSNLMKYNYEFKKENIVIVSRNDRELKDTFQYQWTKDNQLVCKEQGDPIEDSLAISMLNKDSLVVQTKDSAVLYFKKAK